LIGLGKVETDVEVILLLAVRFFEITHDLLTRALDLSTSANDGYFLVLLLDVVEGMIDLFEGRLSTYTELGNSWFALQGRHVVNNSLDLIRVEVESLDLESGQPTTDFLISTQNAVLTTLYQHLASNV
jgi:hypothetical protein